MRAHGMRVPWSGSMTYQGARLPQADFLVLRLGHWLLLTPASSFPPPTHSSALLSPGFSNGDGGTLCWGLCGRVGGTVIWLWVMLGLINSSKSRPRRQGKGEILPLTSDLWHSGICAGGSQHEMHVTSHSLCVSVCKAHCLWSPVHTRFTVCLYSVFAYLRTFHTVVWKSDLRA